MLLRRVIEHVRDQNWTAIAIDFVIVVAGVFVGIQVGTGTRRGEGGRWKPSTSPACNAITAPSMRALPST